MKMTFRRYGEDDSVTLAKIGQIPGMTGIVEAYHKKWICVFVRPDRGRMIWGETGRPGYGLFDRALDRKAGK